MIIEFDATEFLRHLDLADEKAKDGAKRGMNDCVDELVRVSSEITPIDKGVLTKSHSQEVNVKADGTIEGTVEYSVNERDSRGNNFNYAQYIHEGEYELGPESKKRPGTTGWSGKHYDVGNKYLERPLEGEKEEFWKHIADEVKNELGEG